MHNLCQKIVYSNELGGKSFQVKNWEVIQLTSLENISKTKIMILLFGNILKYFLNFHFFKKSSKFTKVSNHGLETFNFKYLTLIWNNFAHP